MIPSRLFWTGLFHGNTYLVCMDLTGIRACCMYQGLSPLVTCTIQLNNDHIPEVDPWAAANTLY
jgi:hypothetical protein